MADRSRPGITIAVLDGDGQIVSRASELLSDRVLSFSFQDNDLKADRATLTLDNRDLALFEVGDDVLGGTMLEVSWGYPGSFAPPRKMIVKKITGGETLNVEALAESVQLDRETMSREFLGMSRAQVVNQIAEEHGYRGAYVEVEETEEQFEVITQNNETDAAFMTRLAAREGFVFFIDDTGLHWHRRRFDLAPSHVLEWRGGNEGTIESFNIESNLTRRVGRVRVKGRDPLAKKDIEATATNETVDRDTLGEVREVVDPETLESQLERLNATDVLRPTAASTQKRATREAEARFRKAERATVEIRMRVLGDPTIRAKTIVEVQGLTAMFDGLYYVREASHQIDGSGGYHCDVKIIRDAKGKLAQQTATQQQKGDRNRQPGKAPGEVTAHEVVDPETLESRIEYRRSGQVVGSEDPEANISLPRGGR